MFNGDVLFLGGKILHRHALLTCIFYFSKHAAI